MTGKADTSPSGEPGRRGEDQAGAMLGLEASKGDTVYSRVRGEIWPAEQKQADGGKAAPVFSCRRLPQKPPAMPPATARLLPGSLGRFTAAADRPPVSTILHHRTETPLDSLFSPSDHSSHLQYVPPCANTFPPSRLSRTHDFILTDRHHHKEPFLCLHRHFS